MIIAYIYIVVYMCVVIHCSILQAEYVLDDVKYASKSLMESVVPEVNFHY